MNSVYVAIDMKSFYASVECVSRDLDPLKARLVVADETRSDQTICLAVSPALKAMGVPGRPRLFEARQKVREYELLHHTRVSWLIAPPRMAEYERVSARIYSVLLRHVAREDIYVYSIDECFLDVTHYLHAYPGPDPARQMAIRMIRDVLAETGITATVGIGTNLYLAKVAMDIVAKKAPPDADGVRIASLDEESYRILLWDHRPLTDFWQIGPGTARRLQRAGLTTMGAVAAMSIAQEEWFYRTFGVDGELLIDHAWGLEPVTIRDIRSYRRESGSLSRGQVLPRPYRWEEARVVFAEMIEGLCADLFARDLVSRTFTWWVSYDFRSLEVNPWYRGPVSLDWYGRLHPAHSSGTVRLPGETSLPREVAAALLAAFDARTDHSLLLRRLGLTAANVSPDCGMDQLDLFTDRQKLDRERKMQKALLEIRTRYGPNAIFRGNSLLEPATGLERNLQIGGHRA